MKARLIKTGAAAAYVAITWGCGYLIATEVFRFEHPASQLFASMGLAGLIGMALVAVLRQLKR